MSVKFTLAAWLRRRKEQSEKAEKPFTIILDGLFYNVLELHVDFMICERAIPYVSNGKVWRVALPYDQIQRLGFTEPLEESEPSVSA